MSNNLIKSSVKQAFQGLFIGDAVSMPVHWYYDVTMIKFDFKGWICKYESPKDQHPTSILKISNTGGSGRSSGTKKKKNVIGGVILKDKLDAWTGKSGKNHYHQGMTAGDSTLNCHCALLAMNSLQKCEEDKLKTVFCDYFKFMTTPGTHNDTYAESWHRSLFSDWLNANEPTSDEDFFNFVTNRSKSNIQKPADSQLETIGAFVMTSSIILYNIHRSLEEVLQETKQFINLTHPVKSLEKPIESYARALYHVTRGKPMTEVLEAELLSLYNFRVEKFKKEFDLKQNASEKLQFFQQVVQMNGSACYIKGALLNAYLIAYCYHDNFQGGILTNTNVGGENCHRGAVVGCLLGAANGAAGRDLNSTTWWKDLSLAPRIQSCINKL